MQLDAKKFEKNNLFLDIYKNIDHFQVTAIESLRSKNFKIRFSILSRKLPYRL